MKILSRLEKSIVILSGVTGCLLLLVNIADILLGVIARQSGRLSIVWTEELARFALVWFVLIGAAAAHYEGDNMSLDFIVKKFAPKVQAVFKLIAVLIEAIALIILIYYGWQNVQGGWAMRTMALKISRAWPLMAVPVGAGLLLIILILHYILSNKNV